MNLNDLAEDFSDENKARDCLEKMRWADGVICPHCGVVGQAYRLEPKPRAETHVRKGVWKCGSCREQFSVTVGTIFEDSHVPLNKWLMAIHLLCASKKGVSAHQLHRMLGVTYKSAWFMGHSIRNAMNQGCDGKLPGTVDDFRAYRPVGKKYGSHNVVKHAEGEYSRVDGNTIIHINTVEGYFSILKRDINGVYHHVGKKHLHRYLSEFDFRYNSRKVTDSERALQALKGFEGKRLAYRPTIS